MRAQRAGALALMLAALGASPALAHHSFAMFDRGRTDTLVGTVKSFDMINPHSWLSLMVADAQGHASEWALETGAIFQLERAGWTAQSVKTGDKVTAVIHPLKDGSNGGQLVSLQLPGGQTLATR